MYLDSKGLVALWREALLAKKVLAGRTRGYRHHPQLIRFQSYPRPASLIDAYLAGVLAEARERGYRFDETKVEGRRIPRPLPETRGQLLYEWRHFLSKLRVRDPMRYRTLLTVAVPRPHPVFRMVAGGVRAWERIDPRARNRSRR
jgi:pyrimidine dimer DNA glycosylase